ncbi:MAG: YncE family protein [Solirubrobacteraceae bacterium]
MGLRGPAELALLDSASGKLLRRLRLPGAPRHLQLVMPNGPVLVPAENANALLQVALPAGTLTSTPVLRQPHDATQIAGRIFVGNEFGDSVSVISGGKVVASIGGFLQPGGVTAAGAELGVIDVRSDLLSLYDASTLRLIARAVGGAGPTHAVSAGGRIYVVDTRGGAVRSFAAGPRKLTLLQRLALPGAPYGVAVDAARRRLWVTLTARNELVQLAIGGRGLSEVARFATGQQPNTVAIDPSNGRVFVANAASGTIQMIAP